MFRGLFRSHIMIHADMSRRIPFPLSLRLLLEQRVETGLRDLLINL
jgi:hypothetical protein